MVVNSKKETLKESLSLYDFLISKDYDLSKIAIELNKQIVSKKDYKNTILKDSDSLEIVWFVGGG
ncbi:bifunctional sulfur carrier protein/thiazole synthase protein [Aliarcobacter thereius]|uniref:Bifunctional sulfur carrier protein/thiazole synthase protein n=2 Tax=Aliarcobacter thereius TaxID=544718 RepID=A0A1C0B9R1_9BACT|nr:sulfur carrier protein ThiS [Aliarcobacter thereius]OCL88530.1 bifunctional sulfur carrier protein/thiazole synthase protein [Aliarcobacter thereius]OCL92021.1 bifunctional sulfur carrier protein/thiazole synthase protein [Aliarcobacter thereius]OCL94883.1 bifunctional sulfur carrier protein/thiazole synthase protein [Aliarcobacter thereius LMG 24486]OCM00330.1 bifunctional sulfur carrier protein/thiazole synthase protein [Aliarcobacter thereius]QBF15243.1 thiamine biosynthesis protein [Ali